MKFVVVSSRRADVSRENPPACIVEALIVPDEPDRLMLVAPIEEIVWNVTVSPLPTPFVIDIVVLESIAEASSVPSPAFVIVRAAEVSIASMSISAFCSPVRVNPVFVVTEDSVTLPLPVPVPD